MLRVLSALTLSTVLLGCGDDSSGTGPDQSDVLRVEDYYPLDFANIWRWSNGEKEVVGLETIDGISYYTVSYNVGFGPYSQREFIEDGTVNSHYVDGEIVSVEHILSEPLEPGHKWEDTCYDGKKCIHEINVIYDEKSTRLGVLTKVIEVLSSPETSDSRSDSINTRIDLFAPNIGHIQTDWVFRSDPDSSFYTPVAEVLSFSFPDQ